MLNTQLGKNIISWQYTEMLFFSELQFLYFTFCSGYEQSTYIIAPCLSIKFLPEDTYKITRRQMAQNLVLRDEFKE